MGRMVIGMEIFSEGHLSLGCFEMLLALKELMILTIAFLSSYGM